MQATEGGVQLEIFERGPAAAGRVLLLHDLDYLNGVDYPFIDALQRKWRVVAPSHPGFGRSELPADCDSVDDMAYLYLDLLRQTGPAHVMGFGFGGWIAAEVAVRCSHQVKSLVLVDALGIKVGDRTTSDIEDVFVLSAQELIALTWHDPERGRELMPLPAANGRFDEDQLTTLLNNRRTAALVGWRPFMHNPKLRGRLRRVDCPTLVVWGAADGVVRPDYGRAYAAAIPGSRFAIIDRAGHYPYLEQPQAFLEVVEPLLAGV